jgi:hypothetical protein
MYSMSVHDTLSKVLRGMKNEKKKSGRHVFTECTRTLGFRVWGLGWHAAGARVSQHLHVIGIQCVL